MTPETLNHSLITYILALAPEADAAQFEQFLLAQESFQHLATYSLSKTLNAEHRYVWTALTGAHASGSDRQGKPIVLDDVVGVIAGVRSKFPVSIVHASWSKARTEAGMIAEFNKLTGPLGKFHTTAPE